MEGGRTTTKAEEGESKRKGLPTFPLLANMRSSWCAEWSFQGEEVTTHYIQPLHNITRTISTENTRHLLLAALEGSRRGVDRFPSHCTPGEVSLEFLGQQDIDPFTDTTDPSSTRVSAFTWARTDRGLQRRWLQHIGKAETAQCLCDHQREDRHHLTFA